MTMKIENELPIGVSTAVSITGGWLVGWSGILLLLAFI